MTETISRLHITPLTPDLLPAILGVAVSKIATNISYHSLQTFPEHCYGYVDLPTMEADRIKKKINGSILKGKKVKVEEARPKKRKYTEDIADGQEQEGEEEVEKSARLLARERKDSKKGRNVTSGYELSPERKVKRGWTETKSEHSRKQKEKSRPKTKPQAASKFTEKEELLFRTKIPKNKSSDTQKDEKKKKRAQNDTMVVHEFEKSTTAPSFLRNDASSNELAMAYEDDKGWVDQNGNVVEKEGRRVSKRRKAAKRGVEEEVILVQLPKKTDAKRVASKESIAGVEDNHSDSSEHDDIDVNNNDADEETSSSELDTETDDTSSSGSSTSNAEEDHVAESISNENMAKSTKNKPPPSLIHPLEALFKKPTKPASSQAAGTSQDAVKPSLEVQTSFSFFDASDDSLPPMPMTPFSSQDLRSRELRSAAPTPDTAHPSRMSSIFNGEDSDGELSEMEDYNVQEKLTVKDQQLSSGNSSLQPPQTDFEKKFWEKRGENNRAWKARRRAVLKEKRQRENRARRPKNW